MAKIRKEWSESSTVETPKRSNITCLTTFRLPVEGYAECRAEMNLVLQAFKAKLLAGDSERKQESAEKKSPPEIYDDIPAADAGDLTQLKIGTYKWPCGCEKTKGIFIRDTGCKKASSEHKPI